MTFKKGDKRPEGAGRRKGVPNRNKAELAERVKAKIQERFGIEDYDPVTAMAEIANDPEADVALRMRAHAEVAQYLAPKRRAIEHTGEDGAPIEVKMEVVDKLIDAYTKLAKNKAQ